MGEDSSVALVQFLDDLTEQIEVMKQGKNLSPVWSTVPESGCFTQSSGLS